MKRTREKKKKGLDYMALNNRSIIATCRTYSVLRTCLKTVKYRVRLRGHHFFKKRLPIARNIGSCRPPLQEDDQEYWLLRLVYAELGRIRHSMTTPANARILCPCTVNAASFTGPGKRTGYFTRAPIYGGLLSLPFYVHRIIIYLTCNL